MVSENVDYNEKLLFFLLRKGLKTNNSDELFVFSEEPNWNYISKISVDNGVLAIMYDGLTTIIKENGMPKEFQPSRKLKLQWSLNVIEIEKLYEYQYKLSIELANAFAKQDVRTVVLKGIALAQLYPVPNHRPCGDFDCFLLGNYDEGNKIAKDLGAEVQIKKGSLHSRIFYKGFMIENHETCIDILGSKKNKDFEEILERILKEGKLSQINETNLLSPCILFNSLFLIVHSWKHFTNLENVKLRQICDWALFLKEYNDKIDWKKFKEIIPMKDRNLLHFAECFSIIAHKNIGAPLPKIFEENENVNKMSDKVLNAILYENIELPPRKYFFKRFFTILRRSFLGSWREDEFSECSFFDKLNRTKNIFPVFFKSHIENYIKRR